MTPIIHAVEEITNIIYPEILDEAFGKTTRGRKLVSPATNLEYQLRAKVINHRVITRLNLQSQREIEVNYRDITFVSRTETSAVIQVSKRSMGGASIVTPLALVYSNMFTNGGRYNERSNSTGSSVESGMMKMLDGHKGLENIQTADLSMIGPNTIFVNNFAMVERVGLSCTITHDPELLTLPKGYWSEFAKLCRLATESYIYKELRFKVAQAKLSGGMELTVFKEVLDEYRDSEKMFEEAIVKFRKYDNLGNAKSKQRHVMAQGAAYK